MELYNPTANTLHFPLHFCRKIPPSFSQIFHIPNYEFVHFGNFHIMATYTLDIFVRYLCHHSTDDNMLNKLFSNCFSVRRQRDTLQKELHQRIHHDRWLHTDLISHFPIILLIYSFSSCVEVDTKNIHIYCVYPARAFITKFYTIKLWMCFRVADNRNVK